MSVAKTIELTSTSREGFEAAIRDAIAKASETVRNIEGAWVKEQKVLVRDGKVESATLMTVTMSCDHRVIDGATGARFLQAFKGFIEEADSLLL